MKYMLNHHHQQMVPGSGKTAIDMRVNLKKIWKGASIAVWVALISCDKKLIAKLQKFLKEQWKNADNNCLNNPRCVFRLELTSV